MSNVLPQQVRRSTVPDDAMFQYSKGGRFAHLAEANRGPRERPAALRSNHDYDRRSDGTDAQDSGDSVDAGDRCDRGRASSAHDACADRSDRGDDGVPSRLGSQLPRVDAPGGTSAAAIPDQGDDLCVAGTDASVPTVIDADEYAEARSAALVRVRDLLEELRLMPLGVSRSEAYGIVERWQDDDTGSIQYGRDLAEWIGEEGDETAAMFTELIVLALNMLPSLLRAYDEQEANRV